MATIAIDFDGVIHAYSRGWQDGSIYDMPLPGAVDSLRSLMESYAVFIHTTRNPEQVMPWLERLGFDVTVGELCGRCLGAGGRAEIHHGGAGEVEDPCSECEGSGLLTFWNDRTQLLITNRKLPAVAYIDDRGIRFESWDQALADLKRFEG